MNRKVISAFILLCSFLYLLIPNASSFIEGAGQKIKADTIDEYFTTLQTNIIDTLGEDNESTEADGVLTFNLTGQIVSTQVEVGEDNFLFYKTVTDGNPIGDYEGTNLMTKAQLEANTTRLTDLKNFFESRGTKFAYIILPNKEIVYSDKMPKNYILSPIRKTPQFVEYANQNGLDIIYPEQELIDLSEEYDTYYRYDTHWNEIGGYLGACKILDYFDYEYTDIHEQDIYNTLLSGHTHISAKQDLLRMAGLENVLTDGLNPHVTNTMTLIDWEIVEEEQKSTYSHIYNKDAKYDQTLLLVGDSFRIALVPYLSQNFTNVYFYHRDFYRKSDLDLIQPDMAVFECVDRYTEDISKLYFN